MPNVAGIPTALTSALTILAGLSLAAAPVAAAEDPAGCPSSALRVVRSVGETDDV